MKRTNRRTDTIKSRVAKFECSTVPKLCPLNEYAILKDVGIKFAYIFNRSN